MLKKKLPPIPSKGIKLKILQQIYNFLYFKKNILILILKL